MRHLTRSFAAAATTAPSGPATATSSSAGNVGAPQFADDLDILHHRLVFDDPEIYKMNKRQLRAHLLNRLTPVISSVTKQDGYIPETISNFILGDKSLRERVFKAVQRSFGREIPSYDTNLIITVPQLIAWLIRRVELERPLPDLEVPPAIKVYIRKNRLQQLSQLDELLQRQSQETEAKLYQVRLEFASSKDKMSRYQLRSFKMQRRNLRKNLQRLTTRRETLAGDIDLIRTMLQEAEVELSATTTAEIK